MQYIDILYKDTHLYVCYPSRDIQNWRPQEGLPGQQWICSEPPIVLEREDSRQRKRRSHRRREVKP